MYIHLGKTIYKKMASGMLKNAMKNAHFLRKKELLNFRECPTYHIIKVMLILRIAGVVLSQCSHENHGYQAHQENHHHKGVENAEPMDLQRRTENIQTKRKV